MLAEDVQSANALFKIFDVFRLRSGAEMPLRLDIKRRLTARFDQEMESTLYTVDSRGRFCLTGSLTVLAVKDGKIPTKKMKVQVKTSLFL